MAKVLSRLTALEEEIGELRGRNTELQEEMAKLRGQNSFLECQLEETDSRLQTTMEAVLGVSNIFCYS
jgi:chromosome segregation ATPase